MALGSFGGAYVQPWEAQDELRFALTVPQGTRRNSMNQVRGYLVKRKRTAQLALMMGLALAAASSVALAAEIHVDFLGVAAP